jgi:hypothetical protein
MSDQELSIEALIAEIKKIKEKVEDRLLQIPGVNAVGIGPKFTDGRPTDAWAITVMLNKKRPLDEIPPDEIIPSEIEGIKTDVDECGPITIVAERPIQGGMDIDADRGPGQGGTLGCMLETVGAPSPVFALTNCHVVLRGNNAQVIPPGPRAGPSVCSSCSRCCDDIIGHVVAARLTPLADAAIVQLNPGIQYLAEVREKGPIKGVKQAVALQRVAKQGVKTGLTEGIVRSLHNKRGPIIDPTNRLVVLREEATDVIIIIPETSSFCEPGDSGAVVLNANNEVIALLWGKSNLGHGFADPIDGVLKAFEPAGFHLKIATATAPGDVRTVPALARAADTLDEAALPAALPPVSHEALQSLLRSQEEVLQTGQGKRYAEIILRHQHEVRTLIDTNKRVATIWHRSGGPTIVRQLIQAVQSRELPLPTLIDGRPLSDCLERILAVFSQYGSPQMRADIDIIRPVLQGLGGLSYAQWLAQLE